ncbi:ribosomal protein S18 acetylase RimI-like enzyme [Spirochaeta isovalerica]|uniref:Ribosomal protein S18 acetylase RimI-like enzyme n=2 Tax=Spirochaeta isovalerica TaxID=150 RepID=A0A841RD04_9SPIO|nr:GNAT family N-acetyltransferase [Spirochaeta isovalerica]MBB6481271.1 ribosomal protein S18 acetylase RimI-like enzyme [Spirochaeta isovalerica]
MTIADYDDAFKLWSETQGMGLRSLDDSRKGIDFFLKRNPETNFICREGKKLVGVILTGHDGRRGYIYHAAVHRDFRRQGIGKALVDRALTSLRKEGIRKVALVVYKDNLRGNGFWESLGFTLREDLNYRNLSIDPENI